MATVLIEGFDHGTTAAQFNVKGWTFSIPGTSRAGVVSFPTGRLSGRTLRLTTGNDVVGPLIVSALKTLPATYTTLTAGFAFRYDQRQTDSTIFTLSTTAGATVANIVLLNSNGHLAVTNSGGTTIATGTTALTTNTWYYIELKIVVGASGSCELHLNGVPGEIAQTTGNFGTTAIGRVQVAYYAPANNGGFNGDFDDIYIVDSTGTARNSFLGDNRVETLYATADGNSLAWLPDSGTAHFSRTNENSPDDDAGYVSSQTPGDRDTYKFAPLTTTVGVVNGVQVNLRARKDDAAARQIASVIREGATNYDGVTTGGLTTTYVYYSQIYNQDPTGTDWTIASVNAAEYGVKEVA